MSYRIVRRVEYGLPAKVTNSTGSPRPAIANCQYMTCHYTGANTKYIGKSTPAEIKKIQQIFASTKPFEYNWVIGSENDNCIYEYAGNFQAAHSEGENGIAHGVLMLLGVGEAPTELMIDKWRWLRDTLAYTGGLRPGYEQRQHRHMPGAATACPGTALTPYWPYFLLPRWEDTPPTPTPEPPTPTPVPPTYKEGDMNYNFDSVRVFDTRNSGNAFAPGDHFIDLRGFPQIPSNATAVAITLTVIAVSADGYATVWPGGGRPNTSHINYLYGHVPIANSTGVKVANGGFYYYSSANTHVAIDVIGYQT